MTKKICISPFAKCNKLHFAKGDIQVTFGKGGYTSPFAKCHLQNVTSYNLQRVIFKLHYAKGDIHPPLQNVTCITFYRGFAKCNLSFIVWAIFGQTISTNFLYIPELISL
jgi:hypothetical protein